VNGGKLNAAHILTMRSATLWRAPRRAAWQGQRAAGRTEQRRAGQLAGGGAADAFETSKIGLPDYVGSTLSSLPIGSTRASQFFQSFAMAYAGSALSGPDGARPAEEDPEQSALPENYSDANLPGITFDQAGNAVGYSANPGPVIVADSGQT